MTTETGIPAIDLFAGPGGLGGGFSSPIVDGGASRFSIRLSVEKDPLAHRTLELRAFFRQFPRGQAPAAYYDYLRDPRDSRALFDAFPGQADAASSEAVL